MLSTTALNENFIKPALLGNSVQAILYRSERLREITRSKEIKPSHLLAASMLERPNEAVGVLKSHAVTLPKLLAALGINLDTATEIALEKPDYNLGANEAEQIAIGNEGPLTYNAFNYACFLASRQNRIATPFDVTYGAVITSSPGHAGFVADILDPEFSSMREITHNLDTIQRTSLLASV